MEANKVDILFMRYFDLKHTIIKFKMKFYLIFYFSFIISIISTTFLKKIGESESIYQNYNRNLFIY